jgi:hypothetical protein
MQWNKFGNLPNRWKTKGWKMGEEEMEVILGSCRICGSYPEIDSSHIAVSITFLSAREKKKGGQRK